MSIINGSDTVVSDVKSALNFTHEGLYGAVSYTHLILGNPNILQHGSSSCIAILTSHSAATGIIFSKKYCKLFHKSSSLKMCIRDRLCYVLYNMLAFALIIL